MHVFEAKFFENEAKFLKSPSSEIENYVRHSIFDSSRRTALGVPSRGFLHGGLRTPAPVRAAPPSWGRHHAEGIAPILNELRKQLRNEIQEQIGLLRADITIEKAAEHCEARRRHRASIFQRASSS